MAKYPDITKMSPTQRASLKKCGKQVDIYYKAIPTSIPQAVCAIRVDIATAFSHKAAFMYHKDFARERIGKQVSTSIVVVGGGFDNTKRLFSWMLDSCDGALKPYVADATTPVSTAYDDLAIAKQLEIPYFTEEISKAIKKQLASTLSDPDATKLIKDGKYFAFRALNSPEILPIEELSVVLPLLEPAAELHEALVEHVGSHILADFKKRDELIANTDSSQTILDAELTLNDAKHTIHVLRENFPDFFQAVCDYAAAQKLHDTPAEEDKAASEVNNTASEEIDSAQATSTMAENTYAYDPESSELDEFRKQWKSDLEQSDAQKEDEVVNGKGKGKEEEDVGYTEEKADHATAAVTTKSATAGPVSAQVVTSKNTTSITKHNKGSKHGSAKFAKQKKTQYEPVPVKYFSVGSKTDEAFDREQIRLRRGY